MHRAMGIVWTVLVGVFVLLKPAGNVATVCVFRNLITGVPCPTCGSSRVAIGALFGANWVYVVRVHA